MEGLLWYDNDGGGWEEKVARAATRYRAKFGRWPDTCYANAANLPAQAGLPRGEGAVTVDGHRIAVAARQAVLLHHYWIGVGDGPDGGEA